MDIQYKSITHERTEDAPFIGALISAIDCICNCKGCFNEGLKKIDTLTSTEQEIIAEVKSNPFNEGIILGGLEWSLQPVELVALCKEADKEGLKIIIYTGYCINEFLYRIGKGCSGELEIGEDIVDVDEMYECMGNTILNEAVPNDYYIKTGRYDSDNISTDRTAFGVKLASYNQQICLIKGETNDKS